MFLGLLFVFLTGLLWVAVGVIVSVCAKKHVSYDIIQGISGAATMLAALILVLLKPDTDIPLRAQLFSAVFMILGGLLNFLTFVLTAKAMAIGPNGLIWGVMQSGTVGPFLMGTLFFHQAATVPRLIGLVLIIIGVIGMGWGQDIISSKKLSSKPKNKRWLIPTFGAFLLVAGSQCFCNLPSYFPQMSDTSTFFRAFFCSSGAIIGFVVFTLPGIIRRKEPVCGLTWILSGLSALIGIATSLFLFYKGLDFLVDVGAGSLGYPIAVGVCVVGFSIYSFTALKERIPLLSGSGLLAVTIGIIAISL